MSSEFELVVVDRVEGEQAILVFGDGSATEVAAEALPDGAKPGMVLRVKRDSRGRIYRDQMLVDLIETRRRVAEAETILGDLRRRDPGGDVIL